MPCCARCCFLAGGHARREALVRARQAVLADLSDAALLKRMRNSGDGLRAPCIARFRAQGVAMSADGGFQVRAFDATTVTEPGRIAVAPALPRASSVAGVRFLDADGDRGPGAGATLARFPIAEGDPVLAGATRPPLASTTRCLPIAKRLAEYGQSSCKHRFRPAGGLLFAILLRREGGLVARVMTRSDGGATAIGFTTTDGGSPGASAGIDFVSVSGTLLLAPAIPGSEPA